MKYYFLAAEGPHDQAAISKLLQLAGLKEFKGSRKALDPFWESLILSYPSKNGNLYTRLNMPSILTSETHSVAIYWGEGSNLIPNIAAITTNNKHYREDIQAFGLFVDADTRNPNDVAKEKADSLQSIFPMISTIPGVISTTTPLTGIYVLPDNKRQGTLDSMLLDCASIVYPDHKEGAELFINNLDEMHTKDIRGNFAFPKAIVACIVSVLKPRAASTSSIAQNNWFSEETIRSVTDVTSLYLFIRNLLELPPV